MEGASGIIDEAMMNEAQPDSFARGRERLIEDVNAVVAGLYDGGAVAVDIFNIV
jgi:D-aminopeptidase